MTTMTFGTDYVTSRRAAARRSRPAPRVVVAASPPAAVAPISNLGDAKRSRNRVILIAGIGFTIALHAVLIAIFNRPFEFAPTVPKPQPMSLEIAPPPPPPPPVIKPKPLPPVVVKQLVHQPPPSVPIVQSVTETTEPSADTVQVAVAAPPAPVRVAPPPPPPPVEAPLFTGDYLVRPVLVYPAAAAKRGLQGKGTLKVHVLASGQPDTVVVVKSSGFDILDDAAIKSVKESVYKPAMRGDTPVDATYTVPFNFKH